MGKGSAGKSYISSNCSTRHEEVNRLLPPQAGSDARQTAFLLERGTHRRRRPPGPFGVARDLLLDSVLGRPRAARAAPPRRGRARRRPLRAPTSRWLSRNALQSIPAWRGSIFWSISRCAKSSMRRSISRSTSDAGSRTAPARRAASSARPALRARPHAGPRARGPRAPARAAPRACRTRPRSFANSSSSSGSTRRLMLLTVTVYVTSVFGELLNRCSRRDSGW